jgi:hypothetical protein
MPNEYSVTIHNYLSEQIAEAEKEVARGKKPDFSRGQLEELHWLRAYLKENVDLKDFLYY